MLLGALASIQIEKLCLLKELQLKERNVVQDLVENFQNLQQNAAKEKASEISARLKSRMTPKRAETFIAESKPPRSIEKKQFQEELEAMEEQLEYEPDWLILQARTGRQKCQAKTRC